MSARNMIKEIVGEYCKIYDSMSTVGYEKTNDFWDSGFSYTIQTHKPNSVYENFKKLEVMLNDEIEVPVFQLNGDLVVLYKHYRIIFKIYNSVMFI
jgi:hypothetical protein